VRSRGLALAPCAALAAASVALAAGPAPVALPQLLAKQIASARASGLPVLIPSRLAAGLPASHLYGSGGRSAGGYLIDLGAAPGCGDANACFVAAFGGGHGRLAFATRVALARGISGSFHASTCGASCAPATIEWHEHGALYTIQFTAGRSTMQALADSAITAGPR